MSWMGNTIKVVHNIKLWNYKVNNKSVFFVLSSLKCSKKKPIILLQMTTICCFLLLKIASFYIHIPRHIKPSISLYWQHWFIHCSQFCANERVPHDILIWNSFVIFLHIILVTVQWTNRCSTYSPSFWYKIPRFGLFHPLFNKLSQVSILFSRHNQRKHFNLRGNYDF